MHPCSKYNFHVTQNSNFSVSVTAQDVYGNPLLLSGYSATGIVKNLYSDLAFTGGYIFNLNPTVDPSFVSGLVIVSGNVGTGIPVGQYPYNVKLVSGNYSFRILEGFFNVEPDVSF